MTGCRDVSPWYFVPGFVRHRSNAALLGAGNTSCEREDRSCRINSCRTSTRTRAFFAVVSAIPSRGGIRWTPLQRICQVTASKFPHGATRKDSASKERGWMGATGLRRRIAVHAPVARDAAAFVRLAQPLGGASSFSVSAALSRLPLSATAGPRF